MTCEFARSANSRKRLAGRNPGVTAIVATLATRPIGPALALNVPWVRVRLATATGASTVTVTARVKIAVSAGPDT